MEIKGEAEQVPLINLVAGFGAEKILRDIFGSSFKDKLFLKQDDFLGMEWYQNHLVDRLEFFLPEEGAEETIGELEKLYPIKNPCEGSEEAAKPEETDSYKGQENLRADFCKNPQEIQIFFKKEQKQSIENRSKYPLLLLEIVWRCYRIPFVLEIFSYKEHNIYPQKKQLKELFSGKETVTYYKFPPEEYLSRGFYEILNSLELLNDLSWYKEIYDILTRESVEGRKVWDSFRKLLSEQPMPSVEKRLETLKSYEDYWYMKKKWKSQSRRDKEEYPQWNQVIQLFGQFFTPVFEGVMKDEVFIGDWMPQLGRYLD